MGPHAKLGVAQRVPTQRVPKVVPNIGFFYKMDFSGSVVTADVKHHYYRDYLQTYGTDPHILRLCEEYLDFGAHLDAWFISVGLVDMVQL